MNDDTMLRVKYVLLPILKDYCNKGWPGLTERDRNEATNALWDLRVEFEDSEEVKP